MRVLLAGNERGGTKPRFANFPEQQLFLRIVEQFHRRCAVFITQLIHQLHRARIGFALVGAAELDQQPAARSEEHTSELQSLMRISYAVFCLKKKKKTNTNKVLHTESQTP